MEDNKYYTPEIEEFHVGFEYEIKECDDCDWVTESLASLKCLELFAKDNTSKYRVKCFDREDAESFGFVDEIFKSESITYLKKGKYVLIIDKLIKNIFIGCDNPDQDEPKVYTTLFIGTIKNKSEFKRVIKQLNIIQ